MAQLGGPALGLSAGGEDELLDAEEVALDQQELLLVPVRAVVIAQAVADRIGVVAAVVVIAPDGGGQCRGGARVVVERDLRAHVEGGRRGDRLRIAGPGRVEVVQP
jgi:hypothetical protein